MNDEILSEREWETFFRLLDKIVNADGPVTDKLEKVKTEAKEAGSQSELTDFASWFEE